MTTKLTTLIALITLITLNGHSAYLSFTEIPMFGWPGIAINKLNPTSTLEINLDSRIPKKTNEYVIEVNSHLHTPRLIQKHLTGEIIKSASIHFQFSRGNDTLTVTLHNVTITEFTQLGPIENFGDLLFHDRFTLTAERVDWKFEDHRDVKIHEDYHFGWDFKESKAWIPNQTKVSNFRAHQSVQ